MKSIQNYCKNNLNWVQIPNGLLRLPDNYLSFLSEDGIQLVCSIEKFNFLGIHVSLAGVSSINSDITVQYILNKSTFILNNFFDNRFFIRMLDDPQKPNVKHFFHILEKEIPKFSLN